MSRATKTTSQRGRVQVDSDEGLFICYSRGVKDAREAMLKIEVSGGLPNKKDVFRKNRFVFIVKGLGLPVPHRGECDGYRTLYREKDILNYKMQFIE